MDLSLVQKIAVAIIPILFAITLHEAAHGWCAYKLGDPTAKLLGRVSINPIVHIDPIGTILIPILLAYLTDFKIVFGWAKPVPVSPINFKNLRRDTALVAVAGPAANLLMALFWGVILRILVSGHFEPTMLIQFIFHCTQIGILINVVLIALNILPIPPLDGSRIVSSVLPPKAAYYYDKAEPYGFMILLGLVFTNLLQYLLFPTIYLLQNFLKIILFFQ